MASHREVSPIEARYQFLNMLGRTQGELTLLVEDTQTHRQQWIMMLTADWARSSPMREALLASWRALMGVCHANLLQVVNGGITRHDYPLAQGLPRIRRGTPYVVTEVCPGRDLTAWLGTGPLHAGLVAAVCEQTGAALAAAAAQGLYHLSLQPENIFCHVDEESNDKLPMAKLLNLGLASAVRSELPHLPWLMAMRSGIVYMAPELLAGESALPTRLAACDQYALAAVTYQLMSGRPPFGLSGEADEGIKSFIQEVQRAPVPPLPSSCGAAVSGVLRRALSKRPEERYESITEFSAALRHALSRPVRNAMPGGRATLAWTFVIAGALFAPFTAVPILLSSSENSNQPAPPDFSGPAAPASYLRPPPPVLRAPVVVEKLPADMAVQDSQVVVPPADQRPVESLPSSPPPAVHVETPSGVSPSDEPREKRPVRGGSPVASEEGGMGKSQPEAIASTKPRPGGPLLGRSPAQPVHCGGAQLSGTIVITTPIDGGEPKTQKKTLKAKELLACIGRANLLRRYFPIRLVPPRPQEFKIARPQSQLLLDDASMSAISQCVKEHVKSLLKTSESLNQSEEIKDALQAGTQIELRCSPQ